MRSRQVALNSMETVMINRYITAAILVATLVCSHFANAVLIRVNGGGTVNNLALETGTVWDIDDVSGNLLGAYNVDVFGTTWDVAFREGTFNNLYGNTSTVSGRTVYEAHLFNEALIAGVFVDRHFPYARHFDINVSSTYGCGDRDMCRVTTPYGSDISDVMIYVKYFNMKDGDLQQFSTDSSASRRMDVTAPTDVKDSVVFEFWSMRVTISWNPQ